MLRSASIESAQAAVTSLGKTHRWGWPQIWLVTLVLVVAGCGGQQSNPIADLSADAGSVQNVSASQRVALTGQWSAAQGDVTVQWRQIAGPEVTYLDASQTTQPTLEFIAPAAAAVTELVFELTVASADQSANDRVSVFVYPCNTEANTVFGNCLASQFGPFTAYESNARRGQIFQYQGDGDHHVHWQVVDTGEAEHGNVIEVSWNANDPENQEDTKGWFGIATAENGRNLEGFEQGSISFDMRLVHHQNPDNAAPFVFKMECGYPCSSDEFVIGGAESSYQWQTYTFPLRQLVATGLDVQDVSYAFIVQPDWFQQEASVTAQFDNIRLNPEYQAPGAGDDCPAAGAVTYQLARASNPTADQLEAYELITQAMDEAVRNYNCYTNLSRQVYVTYNPSVATADGSTNGSIRFGARSSMHPVTAMHEIAHVFGVGAGPFRNLVVDGIFTGAAATAQLREISGIADDQINTDGTHFWPHGLNYVSEGQTQEALIQHCLVVEAIVRDITQ